MKTENKSTLWDFLESNMTNYFQDERIYRIDRLECYIEDSLSDREIEENGLFKCMDSTAHFEINKLTDECFAEALENFTKKSNIQMAFETMLKGDKVRVSELFLSEIGASECETDMIIRRIDNDGLIDLYSENIADILFEISIDDIEFIV